MTESKPYLASLHPADLQSFAERNGLPKFRAAQIADWIFTKHITDPEKMANLPKNIRECLSKNFVTSAGVSELQTSSPDGTVKHLIRLNDGESIECVAIPAPPDRMTFCLSSQVGCPVRCRFCASGIDGLRRNLHAAEILEQFLILTREYGRLPTNIVFMGMGEPLLNFEAVALAIERLTAPECFNFSPRRITVSTSGIVPGIRKLTALDKPFYLALSIHAADDTTRAKLIPDAYRYPLSEILAECAKFAENHNRLITLEYTLIRDLNDSLVSARALAKIAFELRAKVNLIPYNSVPGHPFKRSDESRIRAFSSELERGGAMVTVRKSKGASASAACGQLRRATETES